MTAPRCPYCGRRMEVQDDFVIIGCRIACPHCGSSGPDWNKLQGQAYMFALARAAWDAGYLQALADETGQTVAPFAWRGSFDGWLEAEADNVRVKE